jgi:hypothetical protein
MEDDAALKRDPTRFESLRNFYPIRREFEAFKLKLQNTRPELSRSIQNLGFDVDLTADC